MFVLKIAEMIRGTVDNHDKTLPAILEIPSKEHPYDASKDSILRRARVRLILKEKNSNQVFFVFIFLRACSAPKISNRQ